MVIAALFFACISASATTTPNAASDSTEARQFKAVIRAELHRHPRSEIPDLYTFVFHAAMGPAHAGVDSAMALEWIVREATALQPLSPRASREPLFEPLSPDGALVRVNLRPYIACGGNLQILAGAFARTAREMRPSRERFDRYWGYVVESAKAGQVPFSVADLRAYVTRMSAEGLPPGGHSPPYTAAYHPAYRVVYRRLLDRPYQRSAAP